jgi:dTDP-glucose 4,6-dehydratase
MRSDKQTLLVTGGAGFIGGNLVQHLLTTNDCRVVNLDALTYAGNLNTLTPVLHHPSHTFVRGSIDDRELITGLLREHRPAAIVNLAAETHVDRSIEGPANFVRTNIVGTFELLEATRDYWSSSSSIAREEFRFMHISTDEVFGSLGASGFFTEETPYAPNSPYAASKAAADHLVRAYQHTYGLPTLITNCSNNFGPYQFPEKLVPLTIRNALAGKPIPIYGDGSNVRDWLYVEDHCRAISTVLERGRAGESYNIGGNNELTNLEVVRTICALLDRLVPNSPFVPHASLITFVEDRPGHDFRYAIEAGKIRRELGWAPKETFETALEKTLFWYLENQQWCEHVVSGAYRGERLGLGGRA